MPWSRIRVLSTAAVAAALLLAACSDDLVIPQAADGVGAGTAPATASSQAPPSEPPPPPAAATSSVPAPESSPTPPADDLEPEIESMIEERPVEIIVPDGLKASEPAPLVVVLHGYSGTSEAQVEYFGFRDEAERRGMLLAHPDGSADARDLQFWNATDACCNFFGSEVDDVAYLTAVVEYANSVHPVDPSRVYLAGHSNGGFMSYRLACERPDLFAAIVSLAGAMLDDEAMCTPDEPVSVVQVHGTLDDVIRYEGGDILGNDYPGGSESTGDWAALNGCERSTDTRPALDIESEIPGAEATVVVHTGCPDGVDVELWTIPGGSHLPALGPGFATAVFDFFEAHPDE